MKNPYLPMPCTIASVREEAGGLQTFSLRFKSPHDEHAFSFSPGQFVELSVPGFGEAPISISSAPHEGLHLTVKAVGNVTNALLALNEGDEVGVRGPFGNGYPLDGFVGKDLVFIAGGFGMASLRSAVVHALHSKKFGKISLYYGARSPSEFLFSNEFGDWRKRGAEVNQSVDISCVGWHGCVGFVTAALSRNPPSPFAGAAFMCGPQRMMDAAADQLLSKGFKPDRIFVSLERLMHCGVGKCGHCMIHGKYVCTDGPVFSYAQNKKMVD